MALTKTYTLTTWEVKDEGDFKDAVVQTRWMAKATIDGKEYEFPGATPFSTSTLEKADDFTNLEDLKEADVLKWVTDVIAAQPGYEQHIDEQLQAAHERASRKSPVFPWGGNEPLDPATTGE